MQFKNIGLEVKMPQRLLPILENATDPGVLATTMEEATGNPNEIKSLNSL